MDRTQPPPRRRDASPTEAEPAESPDPSIAANPASEPDAVDLSALSIAGITRRRVGWVAAALVSAWIIVVFARQASEAADASARVEAMSRGNDALAAEVASLENELRIIERPEYVAQQARAYRVGSPDEIPFTLDPSVAAPAADAPGSAGLRLGARNDQDTPLESWLSLLFGPSD